MLKFNVDILFGSGAASRPLDERPFQILKESKQSKRYFDQVSFRQSMHGDPVQPLHDKHQEKIAAQKLPVSETKGAAPRPMGTTVSDV